MDGDEVVASATIPLATMWQIDVTASIEVVPADEKEDDDGSRTVSS